eukprot:5244151-Alexandrium_andersonii.AAC.1
MCIRDSFSAAWNLRKSKSPPPELQWRAPGAPREARRLRSRDLCDGVSPTLAIPSRGAGRLAPSDRGLLGL